MGQTASNEEDDRGSPMTELISLSNMNGLDSRLLNLNHYVLHPMLTSLSNQDRQNLRRVCFQLAEEIDFGASSGDLILIDILKLNDQKSKEALEFFQRIYIPAVHITGSCLLTPFGAGIMDPCRVKTLNFDPHGILTPEFVKKIFQEFVNLKELKFNGVIKGAIKTNGTFLLPKVEFLVMNTTAMANSHVMETSAKCIKNLYLKRPFRLDSLLSFRENQLTLLDRIDCPKLKKVHLSLCTYFNNVRLTILGLTIFNTLDVSDHGELLTNLYKFINRHKECKTMKIFHTLIGTLVPNKIQNPAHSYGPKCGLVGETTDESHWNQKVLNSKTQVLRRSLQFYAIMENLHFYQKAPVQAPDPAELVNDLTLESNVEKLTLKLKGSRVAEPFGAFYQNVDDMMSSYLIQSLTKFKNLKILKVEICKSLPDRKIQWNIISNVIRDCCRTLECIEVSGNIQPTLFLDLSCMEFSTIKVLKLHHKRDNNLIEQMNVSPMSRIILNFGPYQSMCDNLEVLLLNNVRLIPGDVERLKELRKLKEVYFVDCNGPIRFGGLNLAGMQAVLSIRNLQALVVPMSCNHDELENKQKLVRIYSNLVKYHRQYQNSTYVCIVDEARSNWN